MTDHTCHHKGCTGPGSAHHTLARGIPQCTWQGCPGAPAETIGLCPTDTVACLYYGGCVRTDPVIGDPTWWHHRHLTLYATLSAAETATTPDTDTDTDTDTRRPWYRRWWDMILELWI